MEHVEDFSHYLSAWFLDAPVESIKLDNVKEMYAYAIWYKTLEAVHYGYNKELRFMSHLWDEVPHIYRPLCFYLVMEVCFAMFMPNLLKFFLYTAHNTSNRLVNFLMAVLSSEIHCARNFCRNFFCGTSIMSPASASAAAAAAMLACKCLCEATPNTGINLFDEHSLPERTLVVLSGCDLLCPALYVRHWLETKTNAQVLYNPTSGLPWPDFSSITVPSFSSVAPNLPSWPSGLPDFSGMTVPSLSSVKGSVAASMGSTAAAIGNVLDASWLMNGYEGLAWGFTSEEDEEPDAMWDATGWYKMGDIKLKVKLLDQSVHELEVDPDTPISDVKCLIEALLNVPASRQRLIYKGRVLRDADTVQGLGDHQQLLAALNNAVQHVLQQEVGRERPLLTAQQLHQLQQAATTAAGDGAAAASLQLPLVLAALAVLAHRAVDWLPARIGPAAMQLISAAQQSAAEVQVQPLLAQLSGQLAAAAALLLELARAASACSLAAQGNAGALVANTAAVLRERAAGEFAGAGVPRIVPTNYRDGSSSRSGALPAKRKASAAAGGGGAAAGDAGAGSSSFGAAQGPSLASPFTPAAATAAGGSGVRQDSGASGARVSLTRQPTPAPAG
eukprot:gene6009-6246_t